MDKYVTKCVHTKFAIAYYVCGQFRVGDKVMIYTVPYYIHTPLTYLRYFIYRYRCMLSVNPSSIYCYNLCFKLFKFDLVAQIVYTRSYLSSWSLHQILHIVFTNNKSFPTSSFYNYMILLIRCIYSNKVLRPKSSGTCIMWSCKCYPIIKYTFTISMMIISWDWVKGKQARIHIFIGIHAVTDTYVEVILTYI